MPRRRSPETMEKDARAYDLFRRGLSYRQIATEIGYASTGTAFEAVRRAAKESTSDALKDAEATQAFLDRFQDYRRAAQRVLSTRHFVTTQGGKLVTGLDGQPLIDDDPVLRALDRLLKIDDTELRLRDLYPAAKSRVEVITEDAVDAECAKLIEEIQEREREAAATDPSAA
jgi:transposase